MSFKYFEIKIVTIIILISIKDHFVLFYLFQSVILISKFGKFLSIPLKIDWFLKMVLNIWLN